MENHDYGLALSGISFRPIHGEPDCKPIYALRYECAIADRVDPRSLRERMPTEPDIIQHYKTISRADPNILVIESNQAVIGLAQVSRWTEANELQVYLHLGWLLPAWRGHGIGTKMLRWSQARIRTLAIEHDASANAVYATNASSTETAANALIQADGYTIVRQLSDLRLGANQTSSPAILSVELTKHPLRPEMYQSVYRAFKDTWRGLWGESPQDATDYQAFINDYFQNNHFDPSLWQVAWHGDAVVGFIAFEIVDATGYMTEVAVVPNWRRKGVARALLNQGLQTLQARGIMEVRTFTDSDNTYGAKSLYESVGFIETKQHYLYRKPIAN